jgi:hypothetical protein
VVRDKTSGHTVPIKARWCSHYNAQHSCSSNQNNLTLTDLWHWLANYGATRSEIDRKPTEFFFFFFHGEIGG